MGFGRGKVILLGEHAVVYDKHAIALPLPNAVTARVSEAERDVHIAIPDWQFEQRMVTGEAVEGNVAAAMSLIYFLIVLLVCWIFYTLMMRGEDK